MLQVMSGYSTFYKQCQVIVFVTGDIRVLLYLTVSGYYVTVNIRLFCLLQATSGYCVTGGVRMFCMLQAMSEGL